MTQRSTADKLALFKHFFRGSQQAYGTYNPTTNKVRIVKETVTEQILFNHLKGIQPFGLFLLVQDRTHAIAADFDDGTSEFAHAFVQRTAHYGLPAYMERSKSKGYHAWIFFEESGVSASKARLVVAQVLEEIDAPSTEIFPKQDSLDSTRVFGNFINAPLFGKLVLQGRTVFVNPANALNPYPNQWDFLESIQCVQENQLDEIIEINALNQEASTPPKTFKPTNKMFGLLPCAKQMLDAGVSDYQRIRCFRLAVHLKQLGFTYEYTVSVLKEWAIKNQPTHGKRIITDPEIESQAKDVFQNHYSSYGCDTQEVKVYCSPQCPVFHKSSRK